MKDRKPKYPGRVMLTPVEGQSGVYDMERADEPEDVGTPLNKKSLLTDETAAEIGLQPGDNPTPNDALRHIGMYTARKAGDILETMRADPGDRWVLCNGEPVPEDGYDDLRNVLPYNTAWRGIAPLYASYDTVRPINRDGFWYLQKSDKKYCVYDANTESYHDIVCPDVSNVNDYIRGVTYNGTAFVMCVDGGSNVYLYQSADLSAWTQVFSFSKPYAGTTVDYQNPVDILYVGGNYLILLSGYNTTTTEYHSTIYQVNAEMTAVSPRHSVSGDGGEYYLRQLPQDHYTFVQHNESASSEGAYVAVYNADGTVDFTIYNDSGNRIMVAFDDDTVLLWSGNGLYAASITETTGNVIKRAFDTEELFAAAPHSVLQMGMLYDRNLARWEVYMRAQIKNGDAYTYWVSYIAEDADPATVGNYTEPVQIAVLPQMPEVVSATNRADGVITDSGIVIRDPNIKYLPSHDGDTYKFIYTG